MTPEQPHARGQIDLVAITLQARHERRKLLAAGFRRLFRALVRPLRGSVARDVRSPGAAAV